MSKTGKDRNMMLKLEQTHTQGKNYGGGKNVQDKYSQGKNEGQIRTSDVR